MKRLNSLAKPTAFRSIGSACEAGERGRIAPAQIPFRELLGIFEFCALRCAPQPGEQAGRPDHLLRFYDPVLGQDRSPTNFSID